jgi:hypothetical protein
MKKAYLIYDGTFYNEEQIITFAENASKAKAIGYNAIDSFRDEKYTELRAERKKELDEYADISKYDYLDWDDPEERQILLDHGWVCSDD